MVPPPPAERSRGNMLKNVFLLSGMWGMGLGAAFVQIPSAQYALVDCGCGSISTVPLGLIMLLSSPCAVFIPKLITSHGEKRTFAGAAAAGVAGALLQMGGVLTGRRDVMMIMILVGAALQSVTFASSTNVRFAVAYFSTPEFLPKATALVLFGGVLSSLLGPLLSNVTRYMIPGYEYAGNFIHIAIMYFVFGILAVLADFGPPPTKSEDSVLGETLSMLLLERDGGPEEEGGTIAERSLSKILKETDLALLTFLQCLSYNIMGLYMTDCQPPMIALGYDANERTYVIFAHMIGMFLPGLISGHIVARIGTWVTTFTGFLIFVLGGALMLANDSLAMFIVGMTATGIGWNLSFVGPSAQVCEVCTPSEKEKVVGFNDGIMLFTIGAFQLTASVLYEAIGSWRIFNISLMGASVISALIVALKGISSGRKSGEGDNAARQDSAQSDRFLDQVLFVSL